MPRRNAMLSALGIQTVKEAVKCHLCEEDFPSACRTQVHYIWKRLPFTCDPCMIKLGLNKARKFSASELPESVLSNQLEKCINDLLQSNGAGDERITIRTLLQVRKTSDIEM